MIGFTSVSGNHIEKKEENVKSTIKFTIYKFTK